MCGAEADHDHWLVVTVHQDRANRTITVRVSEQVEADRHQLLRWSGEDALATRPHLEALAAAVVRGWLDSGASSVLRLQSNGRSL